MNRRIDWIDAAKGIGILLVIIGHSGINVFLEKWIYSFHLPLFFILSGYLFSYDDNFKEFLRKKIKTIVVPYFTLGIPMLAFDGLAYYIMGEYTFSDILIHIVDYILQRKMWTPWFLACLFCVNLIFYGLIRVLRSLPRVGIACLLLTVCGYLYSLYLGMPLVWNFDTSLMAVSFFFIGYVCKVNAGRIDKKVFNSPFIWCIFAGFLVINILAMKFNSVLGFSGLEMFCSQYGCLPLVYSSAVSGSFAVFVASMKYPIRPLKYLGKNSLVYFMWHQTIVLPVVNRFLKFCGYMVSENVNNMEKIVYHFIQISLTIGILTVCNMVIKNTGLKKVFC